jgi:ribosomal protein L11 methylase PrmA
MDREPVRRSGVSWYDNRLVGFSDLLHFARGSSVLDIGCNRGHVAYEFYRSDARLIHGCDIDKESIWNAKIWFSELSEVERKFEVVDLTKPKELQ